MKSIIRLLCVVVTLGGWGLAALSVHVVRTPDPNNAQESTLIVVPKNRLNLNDTYVDARGWRMTDVPEHGMLVLRLLQTGKADDFKFLGDPKSSDDMETQLTDALANGKTVPEKALPTSRGTIRPAGFVR